MKHELRTLQIERMHHRQSLGWHHEAGDAGIMRPCIELTRRIFAANRTARRQNRCTITIIRVSLGRSPALPYSSRVAKMADHDPPYRPAGCPPYELSVTRSDIL